MSTGGSPTRAIIGREQERAEIERVLSAVRLGLSGVLVVRGEAGMGKTALLEYAVSSARDLEAHRIVGIESEVELGYAALHQLLHRLVDFIDDLPPPQSRALQSALGLGEATRPDRFVVGLATLTVLSAAAGRRERGLLIVVDDAQWVDRESAAVLAFVARRLQADRVAMLIAVRANELDQPFEDLPTSTLEPLTRHESRDLLVAAVDRPIDELMRTRIVDDARGNPLAIVELAAESDPVAEDALPRPLPLSRQLVTRYARRIKALSPTTQRLLLAAASDPTGDPALLWRVGQERGFDEQAVKEAEEADLVSLGPPVSFRHPLIREAIYHAATEAERRRTHEALANATDVEHDPGRRAWHRAAAIVAPDDDVARELEAAAERADMQGGYAASAAFLVRAAELTLDSARRTALLLRAAAADLAVGRTAQAQADLDLLMPIDDPFLRAQALRLEGAISFYRGRADASVLIMLEAAKVLQQFDASAARETVLEALLMSVSFGRIGSTRPRDVGEAARSFVAPPVAPTASDLLLDGLLAMFTDGPAPAAPLLTAALEAAKRDPSLRAVPSRMTFACWAAFALSDMGALRDLATEFVEVARREGALNYLPAALYYQGLREVHVGSLAAAEACFSDAAEMTLARGANFAGDSGRVLVLAWRGNERETRALAEQLERRASESGVGLMAAVVDAALALLELSLGNYAAATGGTSDGWKDVLNLSVFTAADAVEGRVRAGALDTTQPMVEWLAERALANDSTLELGLLARVRALVADDTEAEPEYVRALDLFDRTGAARQRARTQLVYGEWLHTQNRRKDARIQLRAAYETFNAAGAAAFAERARIELLTTGETTHRTAGDGSAALTGREAQIARLAASGATNPEIAAELYISPSTVEYHLHKIFRKLEIGSRRELTDVLEPED
jgi:DNA-binding CsgD family transcriptional regulator